MRSLMIYTAQRILSGDKIEKNEMGGECSTCGERSAYRVLVGEPEGKRPLGRMKCGWKYNITMDLQEMGWGHGLDTNTGLFKIIVGVLTTCHTQYT
jgi:hypothetical protein